MVNVTVATKELTERLQTCTVVIRRKARLARHAKTTMLPAETKNTTALRIIIDSPSYISRRFSNSVKIFGVTISF